MSNNFILVTGKKGSRARTVNTKRKINSSITLLQEDMKEPSLSQINSFICRLKADCETLKKSDFFVSLCGLLNEKLSLIDDMFCLGIGSFSSSATSRYQLALLICILEKRAELLNDSQKKLSFPFNENISVNFADPSFTPLDFAVAKTLNFSALKKIQDLRSKSCKESTNGVALYHMPHCPRNLYNQVLKANWFKDCLKNIVIVGNSFDEYLIRNNSPRIDLVSRAYPYFEEIAFPELERDGDYFEAFNDTSILSCKGYPNEIELQPLKSSKRTNRLKVYEKKENLEWLRESFWILPKSDYKDTSC